MSVQSPYLPCAAREEVLDARQTSRSSAVLVQAVRRLHAVIDPPDGRGSTPSAGGGGRVGGPAPRNYVRSEVGQAGRL